jgi:hypothetical protein
MINFDLTSAENGILLCPGCHSAFDNLFDPGIIILPSDLQYFIDHEKRDFEKRCQQAEQGIDQPRSVPSRETYYEHQRKQGVLSEAAGFGLYKYILLRVDHYSEWPASTPLSAEANSQITPRPWHGAPVAMIRRAFIALSSTRTWYIPREIIDQLQVLRDLYGRQLTVRNPPENTLPPVLPEKRKQPDEPDDEEEGPSKPDPPTKAHHGNVSHKQVFSASANSWKFGPSLSASDIMQWYQVNSPRRIGLMG